MALVRSVAVFCGGQPGRDPAFRRAAKAMGAGLAGRGMRLVYGGGRVGLMGAVADAALAAGGEVAGVIPEFLTRWEAAHEGVADMTVTDGMHARKRLMFDMADAFVTLPGGLGTLDETIEVMTWRQLRLHDKPVLICDVGGSASALLAALEAAVADDRGARARPRRELLRGGSRQTRGRSEDPAAPGRHRPADGWPCGNDPAARRPALRRASARREGEDRHTYGRRDSLDPV